MEVEEVPHDRPCTFRMDNWSVSYVGEIKDAIGIKSLLIETWKLKTLPGRRMAFWEGKPERRDGRLLYGTTVDIVQTQGLITIFYEREGTPMNTTFEDVERANLFMLSVLSLDFNQLMECTTQQVYAAI